MIANMHDSIAHKTGSSSVTCKCADVLHLHSYLHNLILSCTHESYMHVLKMQLLGNLSGSVSSNMVSLTVDATKGLSLNTSDSVKSTSKPSQSASATPSRSNQLLQRDEEEQQRMQESKSQACEDLIEAFVELANKHHPHFLSHWVRSIPLPSLCRTGMFVTMKHMCMLVLAEQTL